MYNTHRTPEEPTLANFVQIVVSRTIVSTQDDMGDMGIDVRWKGLGELETTKIAAVLSHRL